MVEQPTPEQWAETLADQICGCANREQHRRDVNLIQAAFAEREAAKDAEIARLTMELNSEQSRRIEGFKVDEEVMDHLRAQVAELVDALSQYRDDLRYPPAPDSRERRLEMINALIAKLEGESL